MVYAAAHDPYGGIQKVWKDDFDPKRKFSDKERDGETGLDYFGARYYSAPNLSEGLRSGNYRWLSIDPVFDTLGAIADPQVLNLYSYCRNNPVSLCDPDGRIVICADRAAFEALKRSIGDETLASKITWDETTGMISIEDVETDNQNYLSLRRLVKSPVEVNVALVDRVPFQEKEGDAYRRRDLLFTYNPDYGGFIGLTIFPKSGRAADAVHDGDGLLVRVGRRVLRDHRSEQARTLAEELYGHAYLYIFGFPFQHEWEGGFVNDYINKIRARKY